MRRNTVLGAIVTLVATLGAAPAASANAAATHNESMTIIIAGKPGATGLVIARGAVADIGTLTPNDSNIDTLNFPDGTLLLQETGVTTFRPPKAPACLARFATAGTYIVTGGTGRYAHAAGDGTSVDSGIELSSHSTNSCVEPGQFVYDKAELRGTLTTDAA